MWSPESGSYEPEPLKLTVTGGGPDVGFAVNTAVGGLFGGGQIAHFWPKPVFGARSIGLMKYSPPPSAPSPAMVSPYGLVTAGVPFTSVIGIVGLPTPLIGTFTVIVPLTPGVNVPVVEVELASLSLPASHGPHAYLST